MWPLPRSPWLKVGKQRYLTEAPYDKVRAEYKRKHKKTLKMCRWCGTTKLPPRKRCWCSTTCVNEFLIRRSGSFARALVRKRDKGVCAICGLDTYKLRRGLYKKHAQRSKMWGRSNLKLRKAIRALGFQYSRSFWEMDHIKAVHEGGGCCGLENLRTLCVPCHKQVTADQRKKK